MRDVELEWSSRRFGLQLGLANSPRTMLTNLRFADDLLIISKSCSQLKRMLGNVICSSGSRGLGLHPDKTKILTNVCKRKGRQSGFVDVSGLRVEILEPSDSVKYLGRNLSFKDSTEVEVENRIKCTWKKFGVWKDELTCKNYPLADRLRLFDNTVTPTVLYGSCTWTMTTPLTKRLQTTQRRMLRLILGQGRRRHLADSGFTLETWVEWIQRVTRRAEEKMQELGYLEWTALQRRQKPQWAEKLEEFDEDRWARVAYKWRPELFLHTARARGRPRKRWTDDL